MTLEAYKDTDFIAFVSLLNDLANDFDGQATDEAAQLEYESFIDRDLSQQRVVVRHPEDAAQLIGYADYFAVEDSSEVNLVLAVLRDWWGQGLEHKLFEWLISQVSPLAVKTLNIYAPSKAAGLRRFLETKGFKEAGAYRLLVLEPFSKPQSFALPAGYTLTTYAATPDTPLFVEANRRSFADLWGHTAATEEVWEMLLEFYEPKDLYLLLKESTPVGCFKLRITGDEGHLDAPGLVPEQRSTELYKILVLAGLEGLYKRGVTSVSLETWGESEETIAVYKALGFDVDVVEIGYQRSLGS